MNTTRRRSVAKWRAGETVPVLALQMGRAVLKAAKRTQRALRPSAKGQLHFPNPDIRCEERQNF
jgi:hypothetical protein